jgi:NAD(P)-dependent dehydrogenase (short-subunit alcohol dehydrogenase family)
MAFPDSFGEKLTIRKKQGMPEELAGAYLLLTSDAGQNINGADIVVDGGMTAGFTKQVWNWVFGPG